jgi:formylglycine-generating enzyme required for sulfatase activity
LANARPVRREESACRKSGRALHRWSGRVTKGPYNARFPYAAFDAKACNTQDENGADRPVSDAGASPRCRSGFGVYDLSGNVAEWTSTDGPGGKVTKGGAANRPDFDSRCGARKGKGAGTRDDFLGFRCCADPK